MYFHEPFMSTTDNIMKVQRAMMGIKYSVFIEKNQNLYTASAAPLITIITPKLTIKDSNGVKVATLKSSILQTKWKLTLESGESAVINVPLIAFGGIHFSIDVGGKDYKAPHVRWDFTPVDTEGKAAFTLNKMLTEYLRHTFHVMPQALDNPLYAIATAMVLDFRYYRGSLSSNNFFKLFRNSKPTRRAYRRYRNL